MTECEYKLSLPYSKGEYNKIIDGEQWIRLSEGCPWKHPFCAESFENPEYKVFEIPKLELNKVRIIDMNLLCHKEALEIIQELGRIKVNGKCVYYELTCGIDWRFLTQEIASALRQSRFKNIRFAWDFGLEDQYKIKDAIKMLLNAGYHPKEIMCFMICNWKIPYEVCLMKMDLLKVWNIRISDCWFDNQLSPNIKPIHWDPIHIMSFRQYARKHNQLISFGIDPEFKSPSSKDGEGK